MREGLTFRIIRAGLLFLSLYFFADIHSQFNVISDSIINEYRRITEIHSKIPGDPDSVFVDDASVFNKNEVALFLVNRGAIIRTQDPGIGQIADLNNTGKYFLIYIDTVDYASNMVIFNSTLPGISSLNPGETAQLVTVPRYKNMLVSEKLTCKAWDPVSGTGGVLVFIVGNMLELQADINVSKKGFMGADPGDEQYEGTCSSTDPGYFNQYFTAEAKDSGAVRGGGIVAANFMYPRGRLTAGNSGSGGNGKFSGGGGGSNAGAGGRGGNEAYSCPSPGTIGGLGGTSLAAGFYSNIDQYANRIYMGGGGGTGTQDITAGKPATRGGNGGGIVIFTANKVKSNGFSIKANGESVTTVAGGGAGGGGGGGVIVADVVEYTDPLTVEVRGGQGGNVIANADTTGPGGGGGGGVFWFNQSGLLPANISSIRGFGNSGYIEGTGIIYGATSGSLGINLSSLNLPRRGFLVNKIFDDQIICEDDVPVPLNAPPAQGGSGPPFFYEWLESTISETGPWVSAEGINDGPAYSPPALTDTTYYSRRITDGQLVDTSFAILIAVHPGLKNNDYIAVDTVCAQLTAGDLVIPAEMEGGLGTGSYGYLWEASSDSSVWTEAEGINNQAVFETPLLTENTYFRRKVTSGACLDMSNSFKINVLPVLSNNQISDNQIICFEQQPAGLTGSVPLGGLDGDRKFAWESSADMENWSFISDNQNYTPGILTDTTYYRRNVYSGPGNTCVSISDTLTITVLPLVSNNILDNHDTVICAALPALYLTGRLPEGGDGTYSYIWEKRQYESNTWTISQETASLQPFNAGSLSDTTWFRRVIKSGAGDVCINVSDSLLVSVLPVISANSVTGPQLICENSFPDPLSGSFPTGGTGSYWYEWQISSDGDSNWQPASPAGDVGSYDPPALTLTTFYRRAVYSGKDSTCRDYSNNIKIEVQPGIENNNILNGNNIYTCYGTQPALISGSSDLSGGDGASYIFVWEESINQADWSPGSQTNDQKDYQPQLLTEPVYYRRLVSSGTCNDTSGIVKVDINSLPVLNMLASSAPDNIICDDLELLIKTEISNGKAPYNAIYTNGIDAGNFDKVLISDKDSFTVSITGAQPNSYLYRLTRLTDDNGCEAEPSNLALHNVDIDVYRAARPVIGMEDTEEVCDNKIILSAIPDAGNGIWRTPDPLIIFADSLNPETQSHFNLTGFNSRSSIFYYVESTPGCGERMDSVEVIFYEQPDDPVITTDTTGLSPFIVFLSDHIQLESLPPSAGTGTWTIDYGPGEITSQSNISALLSNLQIDEQTGISYAIINGVCDVKTGFMVIERKDVRIYEGFSPNGDGRNDFLYADGIDRSSTDMSYTFAVFNSSGALIREHTNETLLETNDNSAIWEGKLENGNMVGDGTYYYVMKINYKGSDFIFKGFFVIKTE